MIRRTYDRKRNQERSNKRRTNDIVKIPPGEWLQQMQDGVR